MGSGADQQTAAHPSRRFIVFHALASLMATATVHCLTSRERKRSFFCAIIVTKNRPKVNLSMGFYRNFSALLPAGADDGADGLIRKKRKPAGTKQRGEGTVRQTVHRRRADALLTASEIWKESLRHDSVASSSSSRRTVRRFRPDEHRRWSGKSRNRFRPPSERGFSSDGRFPPGNGTSFPHGESRPLHVHCFFSETTVFGGFR